MPQSSIVVIGITVSGSVRVTLGYGLPGPERAAGTAEGAIAILISQGLIATTGVGYDPELLVMPILTGTDLSTPSEISIWI